MQRKNIWILRLTHRIDRDKRLSTHVALVGRAFGSMGMYYSGDKDKSLENKVKDVCDRWGGEFEILYVKDPIKLIENWRKNEGVVIHLTMYGVPLPNVIHDIRGMDNILVIVGSEKVDKKIFDLADYNISITSQPHSEVAALAIFLDYIYEGREFNFTFKNAKYRIIPSNRGKKVIKL